MFLLSCSAGNDSVAMIQLAYEQGFDLVAPVHVIYADTGWAALWWEERVRETEALCARYGFTFRRIRGEHTFESLMLKRKGFPMPGKTWCSFELKAKVFNAYVEEIDPDLDGVVLIGKRRDESVARRETPEWVRDSERHGYRTVWHMLAFVVEAERDAAVLRSGLSALPHRSQECAPCVNANRSDFKALTQAEIDRAILLENAVGKHMFRPHHHMGAQGVAQVIRWAYSPRGKYEPEHEGCDSGFCV